MTSSNGGIIPPRSIHELAVLATREAGADGYALYLCDPGRGHNLLNGAGEAIEETDLAQRACRSIVTFPLRTPSGESAVLAFTFGRRAITATAKSRLCRMSAAIERVWELANTSSGLMKIAVQIGELEAQLADWKILSRARGYLETSGNREHDVVEAVSRHVQNVLRPFESSALFENRRKELESELEERDLTEQAKAALRKTSGLSEDAAHLHLRMLSRKSRRPLREIALEVLKQPASTGQRSAPADQSL
jgi:hypothetical protein